MSDTRRDRFSAIESTIGIIAIAAIVIVTILGIAGVTPIPYTNATTNEKAMPTSEPLSCHAVRVPGFVHDHQLCEMPGGARCLFYGYQSPTVCY